ncbi:MAG: entry exclusion 1 domain-containing protein [Alphaproteobacteria bacterium]|nr:entry exclusion 1 domain-containing protein [Alphaproteobacteria bacterium]
MAKVGAQRAADLTGKSKSTIQRAMNTGKLSYELDPNGRRIIDVSELERCFGLQKQDGGNSGSSAGTGSVEQELEKVTAMLEADRMKMRIEMLENQLEAAQDQIDDLKGQRDQWQKQASQVLITSQFSQKQAEQLQAQLEERERRAKERRQQKVDEQMQRMKAHNENAQASSQAEKTAATEVEDDESFNFAGLWKKVKNRG